MTEPMRALLIDDDRLARLTSDYLSARGVSVTHVRDGEAGLSAHATQAFDVVVLDVMLPGVDGFEVCRVLRKTSAVPVIIVTARADESDRVLGLEVGADDYLGKPFSARELLARLHALARRASGKVGPASEGLRVGSLVLRPYSLRVTRGGEDVVLTSTEFQLLRALVEKRGRVLTREEILDLDRGGAHDAANHAANHAANDAFGRSVDVRISRLRQKLRDDPQRPSLIRTVRGIGYMLVAAETA